MLEYGYIGVMIGLIFGIPFGAIGMLCMQRTMAYGRWAGFLTGAACSLADMVYACIGAFGLSLVGDFLFAYQTVLHILGAAFLFLIALRLFRTKKMIEERTLDTKGYLPIFFSSFAVAIMNPAAILSFLLAFSLFGIYGTLSLFDGIQLVLGICLGTMTWWIVLVQLTTFMKQKLRLHWYERIQSSFGILLMLYSAGIILKAIT